MNNSSFLKEVNTCLSLSPFSLNRRTSDREESSKVNIRSGGKSSGVFTTLEWSVGFFNADMVLEDCDEVRGLY